MIFDLLAARTPNPLFEILIQESRDQIISLWAHHLLFSAYGWPLNLALNNVLEDLID